MKEEAFNFGNVIFSLSESGNWLVSKAFTEKIKQMKKNNLFVFKLYCFLHEKAYEICQNQTSWNNQDCVFIAIHIIDSYSCAIDLSSPKAIQENSQ